MGQVLPNNEIQNEWIIISLAKGEKDWAILYGMVLMKGNISGIFIFITLILITARYDRKDQDPPSLRGFIAPAPA